VTAVTQTNLPTITHMCDIHTFEHTESMFLYLLYSVI